MGLFLASVTYPLSVVIGLLIMLGAHLIGRSINEALALAISGYVSLVTVAVILMLAFGIF